MIESQGVGVKLLALLIILAGIVYANEAETIIEKVDANMRGESLYLKLQMHIVSDSHERTMKMQSWSRGSKKSFVKITYPPKEQGITFLSLENQMWQYVPRIERIIKIPPSMMLQQWMGSDITNDDMVRQSSLVEDYDAKIVKKEGDIVTIELTPKPDAAVVWGKILSRIDTRTYTSKQDLFYDEDGQAVRVFTYDNVVKKGAYFIPTLWRVTPLENPKRYTQITLEAIEFDIDIPEGTFSKAALKRFSR